MSVFSNLLSGQSSREIGRLLKGVIQKQVNQSLTNTDTINSEEQTPVRLSNTKDLSLVGDLAAQASFNIASELTNNHYMTFEPDGDLLRLWLKFQNAGLLTDYAKQGVLAYSVGENNLPGTFIHYSDNINVKYNIFSYFNGESHFAYAVDRPEIRVKNILDVTDHNFCFFIRMRPISLSQELFAENITVATKVDDDQLRYGFAVTITQEGHMHFYIRRDYVQYHAFIRDAYASLFSDPLYNLNNSFNKKNFNTNNFQTSFSYLCQLAESPDLEFDDWVFNYKRSSNRIYVVKNGLTKMIDTTSSSYPKPLIEAPLQDGKWTHESRTVWNNLARDASGNEHHGEIYGIYGWNVDNALYNPGSNLEGTEGGCEVRFPNLATVNTVTEFTMVVHYKPWTTATNNKSYATKIVSKGHNTPDSFWVEHEAGTDKIKALIRTTNGTNYTVTTETPLIANEWNLIMFRWKSGEKMRLLLNADEFFSTSEITETIVNSDTQLKVLRSNQSDECEVGLFRYYTTRIPQADMFTIQAEGYHNPLFPEAQSIQPEPDPAPLPVTVPFTRVYNVDPPENLSSNSYRYVNSAGGNNKFFDIYEVPAGTTVANPVVQLYDVGVGMIVPGEPNLGEVEIVSSDNSAAILQRTSSTNEIVAIKLDDTTTGRGKELDGKSIKKATFYLQGGSGPTGTGYCRVFNSNDEPVATLGSFNSADLDTEWYEPVTFTNNNNNITMKKGYSVGIEYKTGSTTDYIKVQRRGENVDSSLTQLTKKYNGDWNDNIDFEIKCKLVYAEETDDIDPYFALGSTLTDISSVGEVFSSGSPMVNQVPTHIETRVYRHSSATSGTVQLQHISNTGTIKAILKSIEASSLPTNEPDTFNFIWENVNNKLKISSGDRLVIVANGTGSKNIYVMSNSGGASNYDGTRSCLTYASTDGEWIKEDDIDLAAKISTGGDNFEAYKRFSPTLTEIGEKVVNRNSILWNRRIARVDVLAKSIGNPVGTITCGIMDQEFKTKVILGTSDASTINSPSGYKIIHFTNSGNAYNTVEGDRIFVRFRDGTETNTVELSLARDIIDGQDSVMYFIDNGSTFDIGSKELAGEIYIGGELDVHSRPRIAQTIEHQNAPLKGQKLTKVVLYLYKTTDDTFGTAHCYIRRGIDDEIMTVLGTVDVNHLSMDPENPTKRVFENLTSTYILDVTDKITFEYNGGNTEDHVGVLVTQVITDTTTVSYSYIRKYNGVTYTDAEPQYSLTAEMSIGGHTYTPEPNEPPLPTPVADKDLVVCAGRNKLSGYLEAIVSEVRLYAKEITSEMAENLFNNKYTINPIGSNEVLIPFTFKPAGMGGEGD